MIRIITPFLLMVLFAACGGGNINYDKAATQTGVDQATLKAKCKGITCNYDELKDRIEATARTYDGALSISGVIEYSWIQGGRDIIVTATSHHLYGSWNFVKKAEVYINKDLIMTLESGSEQVIGDYNTVIGTHTKIESIGGMVDIDTANKLASAQKDTVTVRFYGKDGYKDVKFPKIKNLDKVVSLSTLIR